MILLLLLGAALTAIITLGGWSKLQGAQFLAFAYVMLYVVTAWYVSRWNRGVLPVAAALAVLLAVFAAVAGPAWLDRDKAGFADPALDPVVLGLLTLLLVPVQLLLVLSAMRGFTQKWHIEVEVGRPGSSVQTDGPSRGPQPAGV